MITKYIIQDTVTEKYLDYQEATDIKIWVTDKASAHLFTESDCNLVLDTLNTPIEPNRFVGRPGDRQPPHVD